ncbi:MAG TPA: histidinol-phosphate transaminase [Pyrinomonadaceae bacterium]|jgi:histidinol-phosphate aminotransferase
MSEQILQTIKPAVQKLRAYSLSPHRASVKINQNENPWDVTENVKTETLRRLGARRWSRYPEFVATSLQESLAEFASWTADGVIAGNGSNELIQSLLMVIVNEAKCVLISEPTFALYRQVTTVLGGEVVSVPLKATFEFDVTALTEAIQDSEPEVVILCSPNNPTGLLIEDADVIQLLKTAPGLVVIDEAYHEFAGHSVVPLLKDFPNLVVLRTFSKAMGLAGMRIGYLLAAPELVTEIRKAVLPYNLNVFSQTVAEVAIEMYAAELQPLVKRIVAERERLFAELSVIEGLQPVASRANFMIVRTAIEPRQLFNELLARDILVRDVSGYPMLKDYFRFNVGTSEENDRLIQALKEIMRCER